jgi:hypothetical protein
LKFKYAPRVNLTIQGAGAGLVFGWVIGEIYGLAVAELSKQSTSEK